MDFADRPSALDAMARAHREITTRGYTGQLSKVRPLRPTFDAVNERMIATGHFQVHQYMPKNEAYRPVSGLFLATGKIGLMLTAAVMGTQYVVNRRRKARAIEEARVKWRLIGEGVITISTHGFYLEDEKGIYHWSWKGIAQAELTAPGHFMMVTNEQPVPTRWIIATEWAELLLLLWAHHRHPTHPQYVNYQAQITRGH
ncbi:MAG: hypothetical protein Q4P71_03140 [Actinomycetaceae bacterium]|nr:hypothetical protein [Actinomycetaceae bacterium]